MQPRLDHFIVRPDTKDGMPGPIVPLIAVDQLPDWMQVAGVPRELDAEQTIGLTNLGIVEMGEDSLFEVRLHHNKIRAILDCADETTGLYSSGNEKTRAKATKHKRTAPLRETKSKTNEKAASNKSLPTFPSEPTNTRAHVAERPPTRGQSTRPMPSAARHNFANTAVEVQARSSSSSSSNEKTPRPHMMTEATRDEPRPAGPQRTTARQDKQPTTAFCRHWCYHGTCKWGLRCRHLHRMPTTVEGLGEIGLEDFPTWYLLLHSAQPTQGQQQSRPRKNNNYANLYTNASVAANAAGIRQQAERQQQVRDSILVARVRARVRPGVEDRRDGGCDGGRNFLPARKGGRASNECAGVMSVRSPGFVASRVGFGEEKLVDID